MNLSARVTGVVVGVVLVATACGGGSSAKPVAQPPVSSPPVVSATPTPSPVVTTPVVTPTPVTPKPAVVTPKPTPVAPKPAPVVTLGISDASSPYMVGYGTARPSKISVGGDGSGNVENITWTSWGGAQTTGTGTASYGAGSYGTCTAYKAAHPGSSETCDQRVPIVAYKLINNCGGHPGYNAVEWYFPLAGQTRNLSMPSYDNICTLSR
jgi:hypothetical protein